MSDQRLRELARTDTVRWAREALRAGMPWREVVTPRSPVEVPCGSCWNWPNVTCKACFGTGKVRMEDECFVVRPLRGDPVVWVFPRGRSFDVSDSWMYMKGVPDSDMPQALMCGLERWLLHREDGGNV